ncbi:MAG: hypothetical protein ACXAAH_07675 [Promethearchaeota archaeon]|jgi:hypothetical protein
MKLRSILLITILAISGLGLAIYAGIIIFPYLNQEQVGPNINYIAPYVNNTHTCGTHTQGCTAELPNQLIHYTVWSNDNSINITGSAITGTNGFFKLDLEIDNSWTIQMQTHFNNILYQGMTNFSTFSGSANCITTGQLKL